MVLGLIVSKGMLKTEGKGRPTGTYILNLELGWFLSDKFRSIFIQLEGPPGAPVSTRHSGGPKEKKTESQTPTEEKNLIAYGGLRS